MTTARRRPSKSGNKRAAYIAGRSGYRLTLVAHPRRLVPSARPGHGYRAAETQKGPHTSEGREAAAIATTSPCYCGQRPSPTGSSSSNSTLRTASASRTAVRPPLPRRLGPGPTPARAGPDA